MSNHSLNARRGNVEDMNFEFSKPGYELAIDPNDGKCSIVLKEVGERSSLHDEDFSKALEECATTSNGNLQHIA